MTLLSARRRFFQTLPTVPPDLPPVAKTTVSTDNLITNESVRQFRSKLFETEKQRQAELIPRIEKIEVKYVGVPEETTLILNKGLSTPHTVAQRKNIENN